jgi:iron complex transport system ATP-binding protein
MGKVQLIHTENLAVGYQIGQALIEVAELTVFEKEICAFMGVNGSGKTSLFKTISGLLPPLNGQLTYKGGNHPNELISYVQTGRNANQNMLVVEFLELGAYRRSDWLGRLSKSDKQAVESWADRFDLKAFFNRRLYTLSDGQYQRMQICQAAITGSPVLILDEPTAFLDFKARDHLMNLLKDLSVQEKFSILISTHDFEFAVAIADKHLLIKENSLKEISGDGCSVVDLKQQLS